MGSTALDTCNCGSGLPFARCHGDARNEYARVAALNEAEAIPALFPSVRARGRAFEAFVDRVADDAREGDDLDVSVLADGISLLDEGERRRLIDSWAVPYADRWASLTRAAGETAAPERALLIGALRVAVHERSPTPRDVVGLLEDRRLSGSPFAALSLVVPPVFVWSRDEAGAASAAATGRRKLAQRHHAIEQVAYALATFDHLRRTRVLVARLAAELPFEDLPIASETLAGPCREVEVGDESARAAAAALLIAYVEQLALTTYV